MTEPWDPLRRSVLDLAWPEREAMLAEHPRRLADLAKRADEAHELADEACDRWWAHNETLRPVAFILDADWRAPDWLPEVADQARRVYFELKGSSRLRVRRPAELDLLQVTTGRGLPASLLLAMAAIVAASIAATECARLARARIAGARELADDRDFVADYLGAAREALALADLADEADAKRAAEAALADEADAKRAAEARLAAEAPAIATGRKVLAKNREAGESRARDLRKQGDETRRAVKAARQALGDKATAGAIAQRVGVSRQRVAQILAEFDRK